MARGLQAGRLTWINFPVGISENPYLAPDGGPCRVESMLRPRTSRLRPLDRAVLDCAYCPASRRCWDEEPLPGAGFLPEREPTLERGALLTFPPGPPRTVFVVVSGCLILRETLIDGTRRTVGFRLPGELVGLESWARSGDPYEVQALTTSALCRFTLPRVAHGGVNGALLEGLLLKSAAQIDRAMRRPWAGSPATERVAAFVEDFLQRARIKGSSNATLRLPMTRADIGSYLGLAEETVVRALARLKHGHRLEVQGRTVGLSRPLAGSFVTPGSVP